MTLAATVLHTASGHDDRIVLLHGFTQNAACWEPFAGFLASLTGMEVTAVDAPGHGRSPSEHDDADLWESADLVADVGGRAHYVGYSMGGRTALHVALAHPRLVRSLTLIGATPGIADPAERAARRAADDALAEELLRIGIDSFMDRWLAQPLFAGLNASAAHRDERLRNRAVGLASSLRHCGTGCQDDLRSRLADFAMPTLVVVGATDTKFTEIGRQLPGRLCAIPGAGHSAHLEQPESTADAIARFITTLSHGSLAPV